MTTDIYNQFIADNRPNLQQEPSATMPATPSRELKFPLKFPIEIDGTTVSALTVRRPKAKDMIAIGDHFAALASLDASDPANAAASLNSSTFKGMVVVIGSLTGIGEAAAGELDLADLMAATTEALRVLGEADGSDGEARSGA